MVVSAIQDDI